MRKVGVTMMAAAAFLLVGAMLAWACTNLATLNLSESNGQPGAQVEVTGSSFASPSSGGQAVQIHWNALDGPVLAKVKPDDTGNIAASVTIPADAQPGYYVLIATQQQKDEEGAVSAAYGTPARASFLVGASLPVAAQERPAASTAVSTGTSSGLLALTILLAILGVGLFGAGLGLFMRETRRRAVPAPARRR